MVEWRQFIVKILVNLMNYKIELSLTNRKYEE